MTILLNFKNKVTLLQHFKNYLESEGDKNTPEETINENIIHNEKPTGKITDRKVSDIVYVKKWVRTKHAVMFRLINKIVQVNFLDHTEIILSSETRMVTYVNKKGERKSYHLSQAIDSGNMEMSKRLKYIKDILTHMLAGTNGGFNDENSSKGFKPNNKRTLAKFSSTTGFHKTSTGSATGNLPKYSTNRFRTLSRGPQSEKKLFKTNYFAR